MDTSKEKMLVTKLVKVIYSEKAAKVCKIATLILSYVVPVKSKVEILQNFVTFSEYMNFKCHFKKGFDSVVRRPSLEILETKRVS